ncbi:hypothetical protein ACFE04_010669 [Oxalis oulophora]
MKDWFTMNKFRGVIVDVQNFDDFKWLNVSYIPKIVFLDDDVVVQKDMSGLFSIDLNGKVNGAVETCMEKFNRYRLGYTNTDPHLIEKGVVLHYNGNLKPWLKIGLEISSHFGRSMWITRIHYYNNEISTDTPTYSAKENHRLIIGGSMRYIGKSCFVYKSSASSQSFNCSVILHGRLSVDESALCRKPSQQSLESDCNEVLSGAVLG